jgi:methyl-accepting chemotaxis protein
MINWSFGKKLGISLGACALLAMAIAAGSVYALRGVVASKDRVITVDAQMLIDAEALATAVERKVASFRGFLLSGDEFQLKQSLRAREEFAALLGRLKGLADNKQGLALLEAIERAESDHQGAMEEVVLLRHGEGGLDVAAQAFEEKAAPRRELLLQAMMALTEYETRALEDARRASTEEASAAGLFMVTICGVGAVLMVLVAVLLTRTLTRSVGSAVGQVQSSSTELQAAASQQATGAKQQATAMKEIATTISELLATSRQIAESAQRVSHIAGDTVHAAQNGKGTVDKAQDSIALIRKQVDLIVGHMLDLGKKSQEIGAVLEIVAELSEQTNILAINATIEAVGSGEAGKRFAAVADEIRKLADRVAGSTKEVRTLIEDVRMAVNTTVMATESGSKAVEAGSRESAEVTSAFNQIAELVATTTEAAREIELSTKQQTSAVEQVNAAMVGVAQATRESEASSSQTLQTASQLTTMARELLRLIQTQPSRT